MSIDRQFDKNVFIKNVYHLAKEKRIKIGELEETVGVGSGYLSRVKKEASAKPSLEFVVKVSDMLDTSIDIMIYADLERMTSTENYLASFFERLKEDTHSGELTWEMESPDDLNCYFKQYSVTEDEEELYDLEDPANPLFTLIDVVEESGEVFTKQGFRSAAFGWDTLIASACYNTHIAEDTVVYLMSIIASDMEEEGDGPEEKVLEVWIVKSGKEPQFLCSDYVEGPLQLLIEDLYTAAAESYGHPKIKTDYKGVIDEYMKKSKESENDTSRSLVNLDDPIMVYSDQLFPHRQSRKVMLPVAVIPKAKPVARRRRSNNKKS